MSLSHFGSDIVESEITRKTITHLKFVEYHGIMIFFLNHSYMTWAKGISGALPTNEISIGFQIRLKDGSLCFPWLPSYNSLHLAFSICSRYRCDRISFHSNNYHDNFNRIWESSSTNKISIQFPDWLKYISVPRFSPFSQPSYLQYMGLLPDR